VTRADRCTQALVRFVATSSFSVQLVPRIASPAANYSVTSPEAEPAATVKEVKHSEVVAAAAVDEMTPLTSAVNSVALNSPSAY
jgi:hypothetical protein